MKLNLSQALDRLGYDSATKTSITELYNEPHRKYHNQEHINDLLSLVDPSFPRLEPLLESIIFHDVVYSNQQVPPGFNEAASTSLFSMLRACAERPFEIIDVFQVVEAINATAHHTSDQNHLSEISHYLLDLDLSGFALPWIYFKRKDRFVEDELVPQVGYEAYRLGKIGFLERLLAREHLFYIHTGWENEARDNIERLVDELKAQHPLAKVG